MDAQTFKEFQAIAYQKAGIFLRDGKAALVQARLAKRLRELGLSSEREYLERLRVDGDDEVVLFLDAISTNFTKFYREPDHFETLRECILEQKAAGQRRFRIWCAASSSGEEPYTIAMTLDPILEGCDWKVLATDISTRVLARAVAGVYGAEEIDGIPPAMLQRYMDRLPPGEDGEVQWAVRDRLKQRITYRRLNLAARPYPMKGPLDAVFCRNVMIYFDRPMRAGVVGEFERLVGPGCPLFIGHSETLNGITTRFKTERPSVYRLPEEAR
ncbi:MAG: protein-glutamate O-methyltransferase CheR [Anaeromyxobacter sp.]|nr:protein-glutamate O-methyltransferase CheR [Anaeromyxobacter sp.]MBL0276188.1 protein-glutamate O-methyltransferase CheR [Anaeromyxobacter sp.]